MTSHDEGAKRLYTEMKLCAFRKKAEEMLARALRDAEAKAFDEAADEAEMSKWVESELGGDYEHLDFDEIARRLRARAAQLREG
jgi:hypothetical protein